MKLLTANRLSDGLVLWLGPEGWVEDAVLATRFDDETAETTLAEWTLRETEVVAPYLIPLADANMPVRREHVREHVRANGPSIGPTALLVAKAFHRKEVF